MFEDGETIPKYVYEAEFPPTFTEHFVLNMEESMHLKPSDERHDNI